MVCRQVTVDIAEQTIVINQRRLWPARRTTGSIISDKIGRKIYVCVVLSVINSTPFSEAEIPLTQNNARYLVKSRCIVDPDTGFCIVAGFSISIFEILCLIVPAI